MFQQNDTSSSSSRFSLTYIMMAVNIIVFVCYSTSFPDVRSLFLFYNTFALIPKYLSEGKAYGTLLTYMFLHTGVVHLGANMFILWIFGRNIEDETGHVPFLLLYFGAGVTSAIVQVIADPNSINPVIGASGAIAGIMGVYIRLFPRAQIEILIFRLIGMREVWVRAVYVLGIWLAAQIFGGITQSGSDATVAYWAHAGGFIAGYVFATPIRRRRKGLDAKADTAVEDIAQASAPEDDTNPPQRKRSPWGK